MIIICFENEFSDFYASYKVLVNDLIIKMQNIVMFQLLTKNIVNVKQCFTLLMFFSVSSETLKFLLALKFYQFPRGLVFIFFQYFKILLFLNTLKIILKNLNLFFKLCVLGHVNINFCLAIEVERKS